MATRLSRDERRAVAQRIFAALCAHYPKHHIALIEAEAAASSLRCRGGCRGSRR
jgi:hypothetical protein